MSVNLTASGGQHYHLSGRLDRDTVPAFWRQRHQWIPADKALNLDLSALSRVDSAGMAMLLHLDKTLRENGQHVRYQGVPEQLNLLLTLSNLDTFLDDAEHQQGV
ncbi:lipid asymmetry maintenance protein MlaB [Salinivibrio sp. ES.052]|uniref:STAS domain-containing protein n=1 Tax=Salinivibrio sp. ES.052 TaxID=1882823 RepID=UPI00092B401F|nr:STAS domain-containing protein [Salinivibrio sp. ES.052]SIO41077.1 phospholipid transport system transporter-binding protein [Salinivibrio sp. ES.052]